jgi:hypothetical protein
MRNLEGRDYLLAMPYATTWALVPVLALAPGLQARFPDQQAESHRDQIQAAAPDQVSAAVVTAESAAFLAVLYDENAAMLNSALLAYFFY